MTVHKTLHPRDDVERLYVSIKEGGRGLASVEVRVDASVQRLEDNIEKCEGGLITATRNDTDKKKTNRMTITRKQKWEEKQLYGRFKRLISKISHCYVLTCWPDQKMPFKVMHRKEVTHSDGSYERKSRGRKLADEMGRGKKDPIILS